MCVHVCLYIYRNCTVCVRLIYTHFTDLLLASACRQPNISTSNGWPWTLSHLGVDFLVERSFLQLQFSLRVGHLGVSLEFNVHHLLLTLCFLGGDKEVKQCSVGCWVFTSQSLPPARASLPVSQHPSLPQPRQCLHPSAQLQSGSSQGSSGNPVYRTHPASRETGEAIRAQLPVNTESQ